MKNFIFVDSCESTQDLLKEQLKQNALDELTVGCEKQIHGRGRGTNSWENMPGTVCFSMTVTPTKEVTFTALEISLLIQKFLTTKGKAIFVKWPNDLIASSQKKCGGVLIQSSSDRYIAGIGLNLFSDNDQYGGVFDSKFTIDKKAWTQELSDYIRSHRYLEKEKIASDWMDQCFHLNAQVKIIEGELETIGTFTGIGPYGEAVIENANGTHHLFNGSLRLI